jgi:hypothetical protein
MSSEEKGIVKLFETLNSIQVPSWVKKNILVALGKGVGQLITAGLDVPTAWLESKSKELRAKATGNETVQTEASKQVAKLFKTNSELANRALDYYAQKLIENQSNREDIAIKFIREVTTQPVSESAEAAIESDWLNVFWSIAETKTSEEIKLILAKILSKEVVKPNSISPTTLQLIPTLTSDIGIAFHKLCNLSIKNRSLAFVVHPHITPFMTCGELIKYGLTFDDQAELEGIGLIRSIHVVPLKVIPDHGDFEECDYAGLKAKFNFSSGVKILDFTRAGKEIRDLLDLKPDEEYTQFLLGLGKDKFQLVE